LSVISVLFPLFFPPEAVGPVFSRRASLLLHCMVLTCQNLARMFLVYFTILSLFFFRCPFLTFFRPSFNFFSAGIHRACGFSFFPSTTFPPSKETCLPFTFPSSIAEGDRCGGLSSLHLMDGMCPVPCPPPNCFLFMFPVSSRTIGLSAS